MNDEVKEEDHFLLTVEYIPQGPYTESILNLVSVFNLTRLKLLSSQGPSTVVTGFQGEKPIVIKFSSDIDAIKYEVLALNCFKNLGAVRVLGEEKGAFLMEQVSPGTTLQHFFPDKDKEAARIAATLMQDLHRASFPPMPVFPHIKDWLMDLDREWDIPLYYLEKARTLRNHLLNTKGPDVLLHGDLHHNNILLHGDRWIAIDPKGVVGESLYDIGCFIRNPIDALEECSFLNERLKQRINFFSSFFNCSPLRLAQWSFVQSVLSWIWDLEEGKETEKWEKITKAIDLQLV